MALGVARGSGYLIMRNIVTTAVSIGAFAIISRLISREEMGIVAVLLLVAVGAQTLSGLGLGTSATKFVASFKTTGEYEKMRRAGYGCLSICALATVIVAMTVYISAGTLSVFLFGNSFKASLFRLLVLEIAAASIQSPLIGILIGLERFKEISLTSASAFTLRQLLVVSFLGLGLGVPGIVLAWGIGDSLCSLALLSCTRRFLGPLTLGLGLANLARFSMPLLLGEAATYAWTWFDRALLIPTVTLSQLGAYNVAVTAFGLLDSMPGAISVTLFPYYSQFYRSSNSASQIRDLESAINRASRYISFFAIPLSVGLATTALPAATLLAGNAYKDAAYPLAILSISLATGCLVVGLSRIFVVLGKTVRSGIVTAASVSISLILGIAMVPFLGILGASLARGASMLISLALSIPLVRKMLKVRFDMRAYKSVWIASLLMAGVVLIFQSLLYSKYLLPMYVVVGGLVFVFALRALHAVDQQDFQLLSDYLGPKLRFLSRAMSKLLGV